MKKNVLVYAEIRHGNIRNVVLECLTAAREISNGGKVEAVAIGSLQPEHIELLSDYGAEKIYVAENEQLEPYTNLAYSQAFLQVLEQVDPDIILLGHTAKGRDFAPRVATKLGLSMISDVSHIECAGDELIFTRPIYAGKAFVKKKVAAGKVFATVRPNNIEFSKSPYSCPSEVERIPVSVKDLRTIVKEVVQKASSGMDLTEAKIIISGGRGVRKSEGFQPLRELAEVLGGAVGASRGACDQQYCDYSMQIGQTGKVVTPDLYIACGISGAIQHLAGMSNSRVIVAINTDPEAPIFKVADYGIVGDLFEVVPLLTQEFKQLFTKRESMASQAG